MAWELRDWLEDAYVPDENFYSTLATVAQVRAWNSTSILDTHVANIFLFVWAS